MKKGKIVMIVLLLIILVAGGFLAYKIWFQPKEEGEEGNGIISLGADHGKKEEEKIKIYSGNDRPIAVMIDNQSGARPQAGLNEAYMVYEIIAEGGITRLMPVFKGGDVQKIGPVRSARHYFLDYALENDSIYVHFGWSPQAQSDITKYKVNNINGISTPDYVFSRVKDKAAPHNAVTTTADILKYAKQQNYKTTSTATSVLNYKAKEIELDTQTLANKVNIPYNDSYKVSYTYNPETKRYERYINAKQHTDWVTKEVVNTKNIIITFAKNYDLQDGENKGRQNVETVGNLKGYYITNGKAMDIICSKPSRTEKTVYKDLQGNVIDVNDGNTFIQVCPTDTNVTFQ